jgi:hypothetical protein
MASTLPSAKELMAKAAAKEAQKAAEAMRLQAKVDAEKKALIERLQRPSGLSDEEALRRVKAIIERAVNNGLTQVQVYRFSNSLFTDRAPAINQQEADFASTLTGLPREMYDFWARQLKPLGYKLQFHIVDFPNGVPGDIGITLKWG